jgi:nicotinate-nucleotide pyrophosphorylase (carboxylating)
VVDPAAKKKIKEMLAEDLGSGDVTSEAIVLSDIEAKAEIVAKQVGVLAGVNEAAAAFNENGVRSKALKSDGQSIKPDDVVMRLEGPARGILAAERVALNLLMRMSGIATATRKMLDQAKKANPNVKVAATRKTAPLLTLLDKRAVQVAGGEPHRYGLDDFILIKDNHIKLVGSVTEAVRRARGARISKKIEIEVNNPKDALEAAKAGADVVMLDNMKPADVKQALKTLERAGLRDKSIVEASGGIDPSNVKQYAAAGADVISSSYMTMRAPALDMSLEIKRKD